MLWIGCGDAGDRGKHEQQTTLWERVDGRRLLRRQKWSIWRSGSHSNCRWYSYSQVHILIASIFEYNWQVLVQQEQFKVDINKGSRCTRLLRLTVCKWTDSYGDFSFSQVNRWKVYISFYFLVQLIMNIVITELDPWGS